MLRVTAFFSSALLSCAVLGVEPRAPSGPLEGPFPPPYSADECFGSEDDQLPGSDFEVPVPPPRPEPAK